MASKYNGDEIAISTNNNEEVQEDYFLCDKMMVETIKALQEKGYVTSECCSGHANKFASNIGEVYQVIKDKTGDIHAQIAEITQEETSYKSISMIKIVNIEETDTERIFSVTPIYSQARTYIFFNEDCLYDIEPPLGFKIIHIGDKTCLEKWHETKKIACGIKIDRPLSEVSKEIVASNQMLLNWVQEYVPNKNSSFHK